VGHQLVAGTANSDQQGYTSFRRSRSASPWPGQPKIPMRRGAAADAFSAGCSASREFGSR
jgi:hypothetical protein